MPIMPYSEYCKHRAYLLHAKGLILQAIVDALAEEGLVKQEYRRQRAWQDTQGVADFQGLPMSRNNRRGADAPRRRDKCHSIKEATS